MSNFVTTIITTLAPSTYTSHEVYTVPGKSILELHVRQRLSYHRRNDYELLHDSSWSAEDRMYHTYQAGGNGRLHVRGDDSNYFCVFSYSGVKSCPPEGWTKLTDDESGSYYHLSDIDMRRNTLGHAHDDSVFDFCSTDYRVQHRHVHGPRVRYSDAEFCEDGGESPASGLCQAKWQRSYIIS